MCFCVTSIELCSTVAGDVSHFRNILMNINENLLMYYFSMHEQIWVTPLRQLYFVWDIPTIVEMAPRQLLAGFVLDGRPAGEYSSD